MFAASQSFFSRAAWESSAVAGSVQCMCYGSSNASEVIGKAKSPMAAFGRESAASRQSTGMPCYSSITRSYSSCVMRSTASHQVHQIKFSAFSTRFSETFPFTSTSGAKTCTRHSSRSHPASHSRASSGAAIQSANQPCQ